MNSDETRLRDELELLERIDFELVEQDRLIMEQTARWPASAVSESQRALLRKLFHEVQELHLGYSTPAVDSDDADSLRPEISSARAKVIWQIKRVKKLIGLPDVQSTVFPQKDPTPSIHKADPRRVFVVHGRNGDAKRAIFDFLSRINLSPIEWEEAIAFTSSVAPSNFTAIEQAFYNSQAAVIVLTGDDFARLGKRYLGAHEEPYETSLTRQARPNVIFEAGMAFGIFPARTLIVSFGRTRPFTDVAGFNILFVNDDAESRQKIASRLKNAGCDVRTDNKVDWLSAGNFAAAQHEAHSIDWTGDAKLTVIRRHPSPEESATYKPKVWVDLQNDSELCVEIRHLGWTKSQMGLNVENGFPSMQLKISTFWCPRDEGVESLHVAPSGVIRVWVQPTAAHDMNDLRRRCSLKGQIGVLNLRVNDRNVQVDV